MSINVLQFMNPNVIIVQYLLSNVPILLKGSYKRVPKMATIVQAFMVVLTASVLLNFHSCHGFDKRLQ